MATAAKVLDQTRFEARARIADVLALGLVVAVGAAFAFDMYSLGYSASQVAEEGGKAVFARDRDFAKALIEAGLVVAGLGWIAYRLFSGGARRVGG